MNIIQELKKTIKEAILAAQKEKTFPIFDVPEIKIDCPNDEKLGDYSTNIAMMLAKKAGKNPMETAKQIISNLRGGLTSIMEVEPPRILKIEIAAPGYINFYLSQEYLQNKVAEINKQKEKFGNNDIGKNQKVLLEFISSNPTGPIHLGNARGGPLGDALANVLEKAGYQTAREFYVNDFGNQVEILGHSVLQDELAQYKGDYVDRLARKLESIKMKNKSATEIGNWAANEIINELIKPTCEKAGIKFDSWFSEKTLHTSGKVDEVINLLREKKLTYEKDGALWYETTEFGDDKDRVLVKSDGKKTYIVTDLAYHREKIGRGFDKIINIQGADHLKESETVKNFTEKVLGEKNKIEYILTQFVRVLQDGQEVKMSKRRGVYFALDDLIEEVGRDAMRFISVSYAPTTHINFDINLAKEKSEKNPVFYAQYAHARIAGILRKVERSEISVSSRDIELLIHEKELGLMKELNKFPQLISEIAQNYEVHKLPHYAIKLADKFHSFYNDCRVIDEENPELSRARQGLVNAVKIVLAETLRLIGVSAPEKM